MASFDRLTAMVGNICQITKQGTEYMWKPIFTYKDIPAVGF